MERVILDDYQGIKSHRGSALVWGERNGRLSQVFNVLDTRDSSVRQPCCCSRHPPHQRKQWELHKLWSGDTRPLCDKVSQCKKHCGETGGCGSGFCVNKPEQRSSRRTSKCRFGLELTFSCIFSVFGLNFCRVYGLCSPVSLVVSVKERVETSTCVCFQFEKQDFQSSTNKSFSSVQKMFCVCFFLGPIPVEDCTQTRGLSNLQ